MKLKFPEPSLQNSSLEINTKRSLLLNTNDKKNDEFLETEFSYSFSAKENRIILNNFFSKGFIQILVLLNSSQDLFYESCTKADFSSSKQLLLIDIFLLMRGLFGKSSIRIFNKFLKTFLILETTLLNLIHLISLLMNQEN